MYIWVHVESRDQPQISFLRNNVPYFLTKTLTGTWGLLTIQWAPGIFLSPHSALGMSPCVGVHTGYGVLNSCPLVCIASTLSTKSNHLPSPCTKILNLFTLPILWCSLMKCNRWSPNSPYSTVSTSQTKTALACDYVSCGSWNGLPQLLLK